MEITPCRADDVPLLDLHMPSSSADSHHAARYARQEAGESTYLVARRDGVPVGHGEVRWTGCAAPEVRAVHGDCPELNGLAVWPEELQGQGIGTALVHAAESLARARGRSELGLGVDLDNARAAALYARLGYEPTVSYTDHWAYLDEEGGRHECADPCTFLVKRLG
ncbi:GNAT family N-acetyltransferase [Streptomyces sp. NPDC001514]